MKWKKLGKIFDPTTYKLPNDCFEFAQSPQALVFDDFVRIYFSTRQKDETGKYLSHIAFVDMNKNFEKIINICNCKYRFTFCASSEGSVPLTGCGCLVDFAAAKNK